MSVGMQAKDTHNDMVPLGEAVVAPPKSDGGRPLLQVRVGLSNFS